MEARLPAGRGRRAGEGGGGGEGALQLARAALAGSGEASGLPAGQHGAVAPRRAPLSRASRACPGSTALAPLAAARPLTRQHGVVAAQVVDRDLAVVALAGDQPGQQAEAEAGAAAGDGAHSRGLLPGQRHVDGGHAAAHRNAHEPAGGSGVGQVERVRPRGGLRAVPTIQRTKGTGSAIQAGAGLCRRSRLRAGAASACSVERPPAGPAVQAQLTGRPSPGSGRS